MIETESIEEFSPTKNWETPIRHMVRLTSLLLIVLLLIRYFLSFSLEEQLPNFLSFSSDVLLFFVFSVYVGGLGLVFLQLRIVNKTRKKTTNLGGALGIVGLFITGVPFIFELVQSGSISPTILSIIFAFGISFALLGIFAEFTLLDETLIYLVKLNFKAVKRYGVTAFGAFLFNLGVLIVFIWPVDLIGIVVVITGILFVWGAWFNQINRFVRINRILIFRVIELTVSQVLLLVTLVLPLYYYLVDQTLTSGNFLIILILGMVGIAILYFDLYRFGVPEKFRAFAKRYQALIQLVALFLAVGLIMIGVFFPRDSFANIDDLILIFSFRGFYSGISLLIVYRTWFSQINNIVNRSFRAFIWFNQTYYKQIITTGTLGLIFWGSIQNILHGTGVTFEFRIIIPSSAIFVGYFITLVIWYVPTKHEYFRSISTTLSSYIVLLGLYIVIFSVNLPFNDLLPTLIIPSLSILLGSVVNVYLWRKEIFSIIQLTWKFNQTYYREIVTLISIGFMLFGSIVVRFIEPGYLFHPLFLGLFFFGYILGSVIWHLPDRHRYFREVITTFSTLVSIWGVILLLSQENHIPIEEFLSRGVILTGAGVNLVVWRKELLNTFTRTFTAFTKTIVNTGLAVYGFVELYFREMITVISIFAMFLGSVFFTFLGDLFGLPLVVFLMGYLVSIFVWRFPTRHSNFRGVTTVLSTYVSFWGIILLLSESDDLFSDELLPRGVIFVGITISTIIWRSELWDILTRTVKAVKEAFVNALITGSKFAKSYYREIVTTLTVGFMALGSIFVSLLGDFGTNFFELPLILFLLGYCVSVLIWRFPTRHTYFRGVITALSVVVFLWGSILLLLEGDNLFSEELLPRGVISVGIATSIIVWRFELWQGGVKTKDVIVQAIVRTSTRILAFLNTTLEAIKSAFRSIRNFVKSYYRELCTSIAVSAMISGALELLIFGSTLDPIIVVSSLILLFGGHIIGILVWYYPEKHLNFREISSFLSIIPSFLGVVLGLSPIYDNTPFPLMLILSGLVVNTWLWRSELGHFFTIIGQETKKLIEKTISTISEFFHEIINVISEVIQKTVEFIVVYYQGIVTILGLGFMSLGTIVIPVIQGNNLFEPLSLGFFVLGYIIGVVIWHIPTKHEYFRGVLTFFSSLMVLTGYLYPSNPLVSVSFVGFGLISIGVAWWHEIKQILVEIGQGIRNAIGRGIQSVIGFINNTLEAIGEAISRTAKFLVKYYREIFTIVPLGLMFFGSFAFGFMGGVSFLDDFALIMLLLGYSLCVLIWRFPKAHPYFRGITTTLNIFVIFWGYILISMYFENPASLGKPVGLVILGIVANIILWRHELWQLITQTGRIVLNAALETGRAIKNTFETYYREIVTFFALVIMTLGSVAFPYQAGNTSPDPLAMLVFLSGYVLGIVIWYLPKSHVNSRGVSTALSLVVSIWGIILLSFASDSTFLIPLIITTIGLVGSIVLWSSEIKHIFTQTIDKVIKTVSYTIQTIKSFIGSYYREMVTLISLVIMTVGSVAFPYQAGNIFPDPLAMLIFLSGYVLGIVVWYPPKSHVYSRGVSTALSLVVSIWGIILFFFASGSTFLIPIIMTTIGIVGCIILWSSEITQFFTQTIDKVIKAANYTLQKITSFFGFVKDKLEILVGEMLNSIVPILLLLFAIPAILYALFVLIYALVPSIGITLDSFLIEYVPGIEFIARIIQGGIYEGELIGDLKDTEPLMKLIFSAIIILLGVVLIVIVALRREGMQLNSLLNRSRSQTKSSSDKQTIDFSDKTGDDKK